MPRPAFCALHAPVLLRTTASCASSPSGPFAATVSLFTPALPGYASSQLSCVSFRHSRSHPVSTRMSVPLPPSATLVVASQALVSRAPVSYLAEVSSVNYNSLLVTGLVFFLTAWGGVSFVKGSTKARITQASFTIPSPAPDVAKTVTKYLSARGFAADPEKDPRPGVVTFTGLVKSSSSVAVILVLVGASGLWAGSLILNVLLPEELKSGNWGWLSVLSLLLVPWYRGQAERTEEVLVLVEKEEGPRTESTLFVKAHRDEISTMEAELGWVRNDPEETEAKARARAPPSST